MASRQQLKAGAAAEPAVAIVQARMGSKRFPGKMMARLDGLPLIQWVLTRVRRATTLNRVVLAAPLYESNDVLEEIALSLGCLAVRGDEDDVLSRFALAAAAAPAAHYVRVCADNPLICPEEIDRVVRFHRHGGYDYSFNHVPRDGNGYPDGLGAEVMRAELLARAIAEAGSVERYREHVTTFAWDHRAELRFGVLKAPPALAFPEIKVDVDTPADLEGLRWVEGTRGIDLSAEEIVALFKSR
jgi:spore coat polysaccharide biosynthesis protein SpsF